MNDLDRRLSESLKTVTEALRETRAARSVEVHAEFRRRLRRRRVTRFASLATATAVVAAAAAIAATQGSDLFEGTRRGDRSVPAPPAGTYIRVGDEPVGVSVDGSIVWVASSEGTITRVNAATNQSTHVINVGGEPSDVALTDDAVWYSDSADGTIKRLGKETPENFIGTPISIGSQGVPIDLDVGTKGVVWSVSPDFGALVGIDPETGALLQQFLVSSPIELAIARGSIWALADDGATLVRFDFATQQEELRVPVGDAEKTDMAATEDAVYIAEAGGSIVHIDAASGAIEQRVSIEGTNPELAVGNGALWVTSDLERAEAELVRLDLDDLTPLAEARSFVGAPTDLALGDDSVWIADTGQETVVRVKTKRR